MRAPHTFVIPAQAGIHAFDARGCPIKSGMTNEKPVHANLETPDE
jgi:hypothetical protein